MIKKNKILVIVIVLILVFILAFFLLSQKKRVNQMSSFPEKTEQEKMEEFGGKTQTTEDPIIALKAKLTLQARFFIERYGSYSSDSNYNNRRAMEDQMTEKLFTRVIEEINLKELTNEFYSLETKVINVELKEFDEKKIVFNAQIQEKEIKSGQITTLPKQTELIFIKQSEDWKIDEINIF
jgi:hypothetical protein